MRILLGAVLSALLAAGSARAAAITWTGGSAGDWGVAGNWSPAIVPGAFDSVTIPSGTVVSYSTDPAIGVASLTLGAGGLVPAAILQISTGVAVTGAVLLQDGAALQVSTGASVSAGSILLLAGTSVTLMADPSATAPVGFLRLYATGSFTLAGGSTITVRGRGYQPGTGPAPGAGAGGGGAGGAGAGGGGGGHGGSGGAGGAGANAGPVFDSIRPADGGGGGGGSPSADGGAGGGALLIAASTVTLDGLIDADGLGGVSQGFQGGGGGAGGAVVVDADVLYGTGTVSAQGGDGGTGGTFGGGGGGGGRVWIRERNYDTYLSTLTIHVAGGAFAGFGAFSAAGLPGAVFLDPLHWTGAGADTLASDFANWRGNAGPLGGGRLVFGAASTALTCAWDLPVIVSSVSILPQFSTSVVLTSSLSVAGTFDMAGGTVAAAPGLVLSVGGALAQTGGRLDLSLSTIAVAAGGGAYPVQLFDAAARNLDVGGVLPATATVSGVLTVSSGAFVAAGAELVLATGTLRLNGGGFTGAGGVSASTGHWTIAGGGATQTWTKFNGYLGSLRVSNASGGLTLSPVAGSSFSLTGGLTVDSAAVLRAMGTALSVGGNWNVLGTALLSQSTVTFAGASGSTLAITAGASFDFLSMAGPDLTVTLSTAVSIASTMTVTGGTLNLGGSTVTVRGDWIETGGVVNGGTSRVVFSGSSSQTITMLPGNSFGAFVSSNPTGVMISTRMTANAQLEWHRGTLNFPGCALSIGGDMGISGGTGLNYAGSTVTLSGVSTQTINFSILDSVVVDNPNPVRISLNSTWGNFTINPGRYFDTGIRHLTIIGDHWNTAGANYGASSQFHSVTWNPPSSITVGAGSIINAKLILMAGKTAILQGGLIIDGAGNSLETQLGSTIVNAAGGSTITFRGSSDLSPAAGPNWFYAGDVANSWMVFEGTGISRGAYLSTNTFGNIQVALSTTASYFMPPNINLLGSLVISSGVLRSGGARTITLGGDLLQTGGDIDFNTASTGTIMLVGYGTQTVSLLPGATLWNLVSAGTGTVAVASPLRVRGNFTVSAGLFRAGSSNLSIQSSFVVGPGGYFDGEASTVTLDGAALGRSSQSVTFLGGGAFWGLSQAVSSVTFLTGATAQYLTDGVAGSTLAVTAGATLHVGDFRMGAATGTPLRLRSTIPGSPWYLNVLSASSVTLTSISDSDASGGIRMDADDGRSRDLGGNTNWNFTPRLLVVLPGETFTPGLAPGKSGVPSISTAGVPITVTVRAISSHYDQVTTATSAVTLTTNDSATVAPAPLALVQGATSFTLTPRGAEPSPRTTTVTATASFAASSASLSVIPNALSRLQMILPGEAAAPGTATGKTGGASAHVKSLPFAATVRAVDDFWNVISTITDTAALSISAASATLPAPRALVGGQAVFSGIAVYSTGSFTLSATDLTQPGVLSATSAVFGVSPLSVTSPTLSGFVPNGARVATLGGGPSGYAVDDSAVERILVDLRDLDAGLNFDWNAKAFTSAVPFYATSTLAYPLTQGTTWFAAATDSAFADGHRFRMTVQANNPSGLTSQVTSTFTFDRSTLLFGSRDGQGSVSMLPAAAPGCEEIVSTVTLTVGASGLGLGGALAVRTPDGWTVALGTTTQYPPPLGYWHVASTSLASSLGTVSVLVSPGASGPTALGTGWLMLSVATNSARSYLPGQAIVLTYRGRPPFGPSGRGAQSFSLMTRGDSSGQLLPVSTAPVVTLSAGTTNFLAFVDPAPLSLAPLTTSSTMQLTMVDLCGNPKPGVSSGTVSLSLFVLGGAVPVHDTGARFFSQSGVAISTIVLSSGPSGAVSPSFSVWTSTDAPVELVLHATGTFLGPGYVPAIVEASRPVRLRATLPVFSSVSVDTGAPSAGTTSVLLSAADPAGAIAQIRFTFTDPELSWEALISTDGVNFAAPVFSAIGSGDPARPIVVGWDGLDRTQSPPVYAPPGSYKVRLRAGGGAALNSALEIVVPRTAGYAGRLGARGAGARVRASGPGTGDGRWAVASSTGYFELRGLRPGQPYTLSVDTAAVVVGKAVTLSTSLAAAAATSPLADLGTLALPATAYIRVALLSPAPSPREVIGSFVGRLPDGSEAFSGTLRFSSASASSDDAGPLFGRTASTWSVAAVAPGLYDVDLVIPDLGLSTRTAGVSVPSGGGVDLAVSLEKKTNVFGFVILPSTVAYGSYITVQAAREGETEPGAYGGAFVSSVPSVSGPSSGAYSLYGLDPGTWTVIARADGFVAASTTIIVAGTADVFGLNLAPGLGARITGSLTVPGNTRQATQCFPAPGGASAACPAGSYEVEIEALGVGRLARTAARLRLGTDVAFASSAFVLSGLDAGTYVLRASLPGFSLVPPQGATVTVASGGTAAAALELSKIDARLRVDIRVPPLAGGACRSTSSYRSLGIMLEPDGAAPLVYGDGTAIAPTAVSARAQVSTVTGAFMLLNCSSVTLFAPALPPGGVRASALFAVNGGLARGRASLVDGTTASLTLDVSGSTFAVSGTLSYSGLMGFASQTGAGVPTTVAVSSIPGVLSAASSASFCLLGNANPLTVSALRAELLPYDPDFYPVRRSTGTAAGLCTAPSVSTEPFASAAYVSAISPSGAFSFGGVSPGLYRLRVPGELDENPSDGPEAAEAGMLVVVGTAPVNASLSLSRGRRISGRVNAPAGLASGRILHVALTDQDGRAVRAAEVSCGTDGASYALDGVPNGSYRLSASDPGVPSIWIAPPLPIVVADADLDGRDLALVPAATIRARLTLSRPLPDGTQEHVLISRENSFLLPRGFSARARAVPYSAGGSVAARTAVDGSIVDADGRVVIEGLLPGTYDVEFVGPADAAPGGVAFVPARVSGVTVAAGQAADLGVVPLFAGAAVSGLVSDAATGLPVAGAVVSARSSSRSGAPEDLAGPSATADAAGRYLLRGLSPVVRWYDLTASGPAHAAARVSSLDVSSGAAQDFALAPAPATLTGRVASSDGMPLFSALGGAAAEAPGAALFLQRAGVLPTDDPLADLALRTEPDGRFSIPSLATGSYRLTVAASGQASLIRSVSVTGTLTDLGLLTLGGGGSLSGSLRLPDGSPVPDEELRAVAAVTPDLSEFIYGSVTRDSAAQAAVAYKIGGLRAGRTYRILALTAGEEASSPVEASAIVLTSTAEARVLNLVVRPPAPTVSARSRRAGLRTTVEFLFSRPLRARTAADDDPSLIVSTAAGSGTLSNARLSFDRRRLTLDYDSGVNESSFTLRASAPTSSLNYDAVDPVAGRELVASATAAFYAGETSAHRAVVANAVGGVLASDGDVSRLVLPRGAFAVDASSSVTVILRRAGTSTGVSAAALPAAVRTAAQALPQGLPAQSDFYEIELPPGVPSILARPAQLTVVYSSAVADPSALNLYWYNPGSGQYVLQPDALGGAAALDTASRSVTLNVGHFSTFVLLASGAGAIGGGAHSGDLEAYNFPNPFDLQIKSVTTIHGAGVQTVRGTMISVGLPSNLSGAGKLRVFDVTGRLIRTIDMGTLSAGQTYYQGWDGRNDDGRDVASGLYVGQVEIGSKRKSFKMAVIK